MPGLAFRDIKYRERGEGEIGAEVVRAFHDELSCALLEGFWVFGTKYLFEKGIRSGFYSGPQSGDEPSRDSFYICDKVGAHLVTSKSNN